MNDSTKRTIRTVAQVTLGACAAIAIVVPIVGTQFDQSAAVGAVALAATGVVTKAWTALEDAGLIPPWLKDKPTAPAQPTPPPPQA